MSISNKLTQLNQIKQDIKAAINAKGGSVGDDMTTYAAAILNLKQSYRLQLVVSDVDGAFTDSYWNFIINYADGTSKAKSLILDHYTTLDEANVISYTLVSSQIVTSYSTSTSSLQAWGFIGANNVARAVSATADFISMAAGQSRILLTDVLIEATLEQ